MIPWLIFRRADTDAENWLESSPWPIRFSPSSRCPPNTALNVPTTLVYNLYKGEIGYALSNSLDLFVREYIALSLQRRTKTLEHADLLKSRIRNPWSSHPYPISRMSIPFASTLLLFIDKKTSRHTDGTMASKESGKCPSHQILSADWAFFW